MLTKGIYRKEKFLNPLKVPSYFRADETAHLSGFYIRVRRQVCYIYFAGACALWVQFAELVMRNYVG